jgi:hypothetical protein
MRDFETTEESYAYEQGRLDEKAEVLAFVDSIFNVAPIMTLEVMRVFQARLQKEIAMDRVSFRSRL